MSEQRNRLLKNPKKTFDFVEYLIIKGTLIALLALAALGFIWHALKLLWNLL